MFSMPHFNAPKISAGSNFGGIHYLFNGNADDENGNYHGSPVNITYGGSGDEQYAEFDTTGRIETGYWLPTGSGTEFTIHVVFDDNPQSLQGVFSTMTGTSNRSGLKLTLDGYLEVTLVAHTFSSFESRTLIEGKNRVTIVAGNDTHKLYVNDVYRGQVGNPSTLVHEGALEIGSHNIESTAASFSGKIYEFRIIERALTLEEIESL